MTDLQKAILDYRKTYKHGQKGGTVKALSQLVGKSPRTIVYWINGGSPLGTRAHKDIPGTVDRTREENTARFIAMIQEATAARL